MYPSYLEDKILPSPPFLIYKLRVAFCAVLFIAHSFVIGLFVVWKFNVDVNKGRKLFYSFPT